ncbi:MAG: glucoamylase family protein [Actinomycetota bacterium]
MILYISKFTKPVRSGFCVVLILLFLYSFGSFSAVAQTTQNYQLTKEDEAFLDDLERRAFLFFWEHSGKKNGLTLDRARTNGDAPGKDEDHHNVGSIASTGFALTGLCIAADRNWVKPAEAKERARITLEFFANRAFTKDGWFYHWIDLETEERRWRSEVSTIDSALLLGGVLSVRQCFADDQEIVRLATKIYNRVDFPAMLNGDKYLLVHGWHNESGYIKNRWHDYSEEAILYLLGIGSPTHPLPWKSWYAWERGWQEYGGYKYLAAVSPLFIHQYSHAWIDFRGKREHYKDFNVDYFENSVKATRAQRQFFIDVLSKEFPKYGPNIWGLTASDFAGGYTAWGAPPRSPETDGSVVPCAPAGSLMFTPDISLAALQEMKAKYGDKIYGRYGFTDAFNPHNGWVNRDVLGIDVGITLLSAENLRSGNVWKWFMQNKEIPAAFKRIKLK